MRTDGRTDMTKLVVAFRNFANGPKKGEREPCNFTRKTSYFPPAAMTNKHNLSATSVSENISVG